ncbi:U3 small nucleolar ribonucleoprotein MPP10 [Anopheles sinensis]|uniref:U3 small nucleolar ribonucleoprotein MPP10 n=1 Tax=Anopheles sinensis TaxID=74873 RepID=A0A084VYN5_ANOSI|nr:U3 small nucleolar ribonucleoprotein MPP10 [Anopheles sinensis]
MVKSIVLTAKASKKELGLEACLNRFRKHTKRPEVFLKLQTQLSNDLKSLLKTVYDHGTKTGFNKANDAPYLDELVTEQMDEEQIWQQLELKNEYFVDQDLKKTSEILSKKDKALQLSFSTETKSDYGSGEDRSADEEEDSAGENGIEQESEDERMNGVSPKKTKKSKKGKKSKKSKAKGSIVDDRFFRLDDMAKFLDEEDERERRRQNGLGEKNPLIEIDYFDDHAGEDDDEDDAAEMKYSDFFDDDDDDEEDEDAENEEEEEDYGSEGIEDDDEGSEAGMEQEDDEEESDMEQDQDTTANVAEEDELSDEAAVERNRKLRYDIYKSQGGIPVEEEEKPKKVTFEQPESSDSEDDNKVDKTNEPKSSFELRQEKLGEKISKMEEKLLKEKPWQLKGENFCRNSPPKLAAGGGAGV